MNIIKIAPMRQMIKVFTWMTLFFVILQLMLVTVQAVEVGVMGCSLTEDAVTGAIMQGETRVWTGMYFVSGSIGRLAEQNDPYNYWAAFYGNYWLYPADVVLFQVCSGGSNADTYESAVSVLNGIYATGVQSVYVSYPPSYAGADKCAVAGGKTGRDNMVAIVDRLVSDRLALKGPDFGPLTRYQMRDGCHANYTGRLSEGKQLINWINML